MATASDDQQVNASDVACGRCGQHDCACGGVQAGPAASVTTEYRVICPRGRFYAIASYPTGPYVTTDHADAQDVRFRRDETHGFCDRGHRVESRTVTYGEWS